MASFSAASFSVSGFSVTAFDFDGAVPPTAADGGQVAPARKAFRPLPPPSALPPLRAVPHTIEAVFRPAKQPYVPVGENAVATPPRKPDGHSEGVGQLLAQLTAGYPVSGSPDELAAIREALRRNQELLDRLEAERLAGIKQQKTMAALLFLMMEM